MEKWKVEYQEQSNGVWKVKLTYQHGAVVEATGTDLDLLIEQGKKAAVELEEQIEKKIKAQRNLYGS